MLVYRSGALPWLTRRLAATGRMALSNYLFASILFTTVFYGYGLDYFAANPPAQLYVFVLLAWAFPSSGSVRSGSRPSATEPAEWIWRSLTYWKLQPMRSRVT